MKQIWRIAKGEWRYWLRSHLALGGALVFTALIVATSVFTALRIESETHARHHQQTEAEETFLSQPDRHPHRMVHYGHYVFRAPVPLAIVDPGLDAVTGQSIFLEGHRQNTAMFADSGASADLGGLSVLTPATVYQLFAPLLIILMGYGSVARERESSSLASLLALGIEGYSLILGKTVALLTLSVFILLPLMVMGAVAFTHGESFAAVLWLLGVYWMYLAVWAMLTLCFSAILHKRATVLAVLGALWLSFTLVLPSIAVNLATRSAPLAGKIETDLIMLNDLRKLGDGHNANDPAFRQMRADLLKQYGVERVEDLPINFRGLVAVEAERKLTDVMNTYANARMANESDQTATLSSYGWLTPALAVSFASRAISGTDLEHYHRFLKEAEKIRFAFVQGLNQAHVDKLSYEDDVNRNKDEASWRRARVDAANWQVLQKFEFQPADIADRTANAAQSITALWLWFVLSSAVLWWIGRRIEF